MAHQPEHGGNSHSQQPSVSDELDTLAYYSQDDTEVLQPPNTSALYTQQNRSVPNLQPSQRLSQQSDVLDPNSAPPPPYDATAALDQFSALHVSDPITRGGSAMAFRTEPAEPVPRTGTSMSVRPPHAQHRMGLPQGPATNISHAPQGHAPEPRFNDAASVRSGHSGHSAHSGYYAARPERTDSLQDSDRASNYSFQGVHPQNGYGTPTAASPAQHYPPQQVWQAPPQGYAPPPQNYNPLYSAASDVLGMGPPPGAAPPMQPGAYQQQGPYPPSRASSLASSQSSQYMAPYPPPNGLGPYPAGASLMRGPSVSSVGSGSSTGPAPSSISSPTSTPSIPEEPEFVTRPPMDRAGTSSFTSMRTDKSKAIDLSAPPYTKQYIDQYRQRIKDDPDPEAHFQYAKYLIEAARKVGADAKDQRAVKKYRDTLVQESLKVVRKLATQGEAYSEAQFFLANCHGTGMLGLQVDHERAYHLYLQAAKQSHAAACYRVAVCNEIGAGTRREPQRAAAFYSRAASLGDTAAMYKLGVILLRGSLGQQPNPRDAVGWLKRAAEQADEDNPHALHELALLYENQNSGIVPYDPHYAKELYTKAGQLGYTHSQFKLGQCYEYGALTCPVDPKRSIAWYTRAAEKGHSEAELALSGWYLTGSDNVLKQSDSEAYLWARRAANKGLSKAEYAVGYYAEVGIGVKQDIEFAKRWYMRAAAQGNKRAMNRLTEMKRAGNKRQQMARPTRQDAKEECIIA